MDHAPVVTRAWVLHPDIKSDRNRRNAADALSEAVSLAEALPDLEVVNADVVPLPKPHASALFGSGKIEELAAQFKAAEIDLVLIDGPVTPVQQRNLEKKWKVKLLDRTSLILEIFSDRAATREGVLQVEMAALTYQRTRLVRAWTHLERQRGGLGFVVPVKPRSRPIAAPSTNNCSASNGSSKRSSKPALCTGQHGPKCLIRSSHLWAIQTQANPHSSTGSQGPKSWPRTCSLQRSIQPCDHWNLRTDQR
jgi:hypothetical protein